MASTYDRNSKYHDYLLLIDTYSGIYFVLIKGHGPACRYNLETDNYASFTPENYETLNTCNE